MLGLQTCFSTGMVQLTVHWVVLLMMYHVFCAVVETHFNTSREITGICIQRYCMGKSYPCWNEEKLSFLKGRFSFFPVAFSKVKMQKVSAGIRKKLKCLKYPGINWMLLFCVLTWEQTNAYCTCNCSSCGLKYVQQNCQKE